MREEDKNSFRVPLPTNGVSMPVGVYIGHTDGGAVTLETDGKVVLSDAEATWVLREIASRIGKIRAITLGKNSPDTGRQRQPGDVIYCDPPSDRIIIGATPVRSEGSKE